MKKAQQIPKEENVMIVLKTLVKRAEETAVDVHSMKYDLKDLKLRFIRIEHDTSILKVDTEKTREEMGGRFTKLENNLTGMEQRLNKRITDVGDLITIELGKRARKVEKRVTRLEQIPQVVQ